MSKNSQKLKGSKTGERQKREKSLEKQAERAYEKQLELAATPAEFSLKDHNFGRPLSSMAQLTVLLLGIAGIVFAILFASTILTDFALVSGGFSVVDYFRECEPVVACRIADGLEIVVILFLLIFSVICLKMALTNRYPKRFVLRLGAGLIAASTICYIADMVLEQIFW